jgi:hypothetical protein
MAKSIAQYLEEKRKNPHSIIIMDGRPYIFIESGKAVYIDMLTGEIKTF